MSLFGRGGSVTDAQLLVGSHSTEPAVPAESIQIELQKILSSHVFSASGRLRQFLRFVVEQSLRGQRETLKESVLGVRVFGRGHAFDPRLDAIVRVEAGRLRAKLTEYYEIEGRQDPVVIELHKGGYAPVFHDRNHTPVAPQAVAPPMAGQLASNNTQSTRLTSIVVLPFLNLSADPENEYFSDGLTEEVISGLTRIPGLRVIARSTAFRYKGQAQDIRKVGTELNVSAALEGSVRRIGDHLRITTQLVDTVSCFHIWSDSYEREMKDILAIQRDIADAISGMVHEQFPATSRPPVNDSTSSVEAYDLYLRGIYFESKRSSEGLAKGLNHLQLAAAMNPRCAPIFARLANSYILQAAYGLEAPHVALTRATEAVTKTLEIDNTLAQAYAARACVSALYNWEWTAAEADFRRALELNPGVPEIHHRYAFFFLSPAGRGEEALRHIQQAKNLDPMSLVLQAAECAVLYWSRQYEAAIATGLKALELESSYYPAYMYLSWAYREYGMHAQSIEAGQEAVRLSAGTPLALGGLGLSYAMAGKMSEARSVIERLQQRAYVPTATIALVYARMGEIDQAFEWLGRAQQERSPSLVYLKVGSWDERMRADPRFDALIRIVGVGAAVHA